LPFVKVCLKTTIPKAYPENPATLGEHLLRRRKVLGLRQKEVAKLLGVDTFTVLNWERGKTAPKIRHLPQIVSFLGYDPAPPPAARTFGDELFAARRKLGVSRKKLARLMGVDDSTVRRWEEAKSMPRGPQLSALCRFMKKAAL
jgi:DNA-binding transcriptional regulator YiaG